MSMSYRDDEKARYAKAKYVLFSEPACEPGMYKGKPREFCLAATCGTENLLPGTREQAIAYFADRKIPWHDGIAGGPSNHLCCSQSAAVNTWFTFRHSPLALASALRGLGWPVAEMLPFTLDDFGVGSPEMNAVVDSSVGGEIAPHPYIAFEWIGAKNYLRETSRGRVASDAGRSRGKGFTSADFAFRFRRTDGRVQIVLGEWKYTELYTFGADKRYSDSGTDRAEIYRPHVAESQLRLGNLDVADLMFDPFDQLMRLQLLASTMEREHEMEADVVSVLHVAPRANVQLATTITAPALVGRGKTMHSVWASVVQPDRFIGVYTETLLGALYPYAPDANWVAGMVSRYGW